MTAADIGSIGAAEDSPPVGKAEQIPFEADGIQYTVERRDGRTLHKATRRDADGRPLSEIEADPTHWRERLMACLVGSETQGPTARATVTTRERRRTQSVGKISR